MISQCRYCCCYCCYKCIGDSFESLTVFLGLSSVFPYNYWVFQGRWNRTHLYLSDPQRPSLFGSLWVADGLCRFFSCVSICSFTIFHGLSQNFATLSDQQRAKKTIWKPGFKVDQEYCRWQFSNSFFS